MLLTIYWDIGWGPSHKCLSRWKFNPLQGREERSSARVIAGSSNSTPREEEAAGGYVAAAAVNILDLTGTNQTMVGFMEWTATTP